MMATKSRVIRPQECSYIDLRDAVYGDEMLGICLACGELHYECEPDARNYECDYCHLNQVHGLPEAQIMDMLIITGWEEDDGNSD